MQTVGGLLLAQLSFSLDRDVALVSHLTRGGPVPEGLADALRSAYADVLVFDHGLFAAAWHSEQDTPALLAEHDRLVKAVTARYAPERIVLLRSVIRRFFWAGRAPAPRRYADDPRDVDALRSFLDALDARFREATGCLVVDEAAAHLSRRDTIAHDPWLPGDAILAVEDAVLAAVRAGAPTPAAPTDSDFAAAVRRELLAGDIAPERVLELLPDGGLDTHDDVAALAAAFAADREADWSAVAGKALPVRGVVFEAMQARFESNVRALRAYPHFYLRRTALDSPPPSSVRLVTRLFRSWFLVVDPARPRAIGLLRYRRGRFRPQAFCDAGYVCEPYHVEAALESWEAYFERGRRGDTAPFRLSFVSTEAFCESLEYLDYADILANENYCITVNGKIPSRIKWRPRVDTRFLFDPRTRVRILSAGFGNQLVQYALAMKVAEQHGLRLFLDDLHFDDPKIRLVNAHARPDLLGLVNPAGVFSELFSRRLRQRRRTYRHHPLDRSEYVALGLPEQVLVIDRWKLAKLLTRPIGSRALVVAPKSLAQAERSIASPPPGVCFIDFLLAPYFVRRGLARDKAVWERVLTWPGFVSDAALVGERMLASDAVALHVRRGDRAAIGAANSDEYYRAYLERIAALTEYPDKQLFVFSDDLDYCRAHHDELGLGLLGGPVSFVAGNRHFASVDDFHLMTLAKIIVCGFSSFSATAALTSARIEYIFGAGYGAEGSDMWDRSQLDGQAGEGVSAGSRSLRAALRRAAATLRR